MCAASRVVMAGASPYEVDAAMQSWGMAKGPYWAADGGGLVDETGDALVLRMLENDWTGKQTGQGFYRYDQGEAGESTDVLALIEDVRSQAGITPRAFLTAEIQRQCMLAMVNEGAKLVEQGAARCAGDIDIVMVHAHGFPSWRGGRMKAVEMLGLLPVQQA